MVRTAKKRRDPVLAAQRRLDRNVKKWAEDLKPQSHTFALESTGGAMSSSAFYEHPLRAEGETHGRSVVGPSDVGVRHIPGLVYRITYEIVGVDPARFIKINSFICDEGEKFLRLKRKQSPQQWAKQTYAKHGDECIEQLAKHRLYVAEAQRFLAFVATIYPPKKT